jgi:hypothetical protein
MQVTMVVMTMLMISSERNAGKFPKDVCHYAEQGGGY